MGKKVLYISYDGMTDPLGQSQVLPYLTGLSKLGYEFTILSFEKEERYQRYRQVIENITSAAGIKWEPLKFTSRPPVLSKFYDLLRMRRKTFSLQRQYGYDIVHCRSYIAADIGLKLKRKAGVRFLFDMRGFWPDEKKDGGSWDQRNWFFRLLYRRYKKKETRFVQNADSIISLTEAGRKEMTHWQGYTPSVPVVVIPCCSDMDHFTLTSASDKQAGRKLLGLPQDDLIISYLGSVGTWYMLDKMLLLFTYVKKKYPAAKFLFITHSAPAQILSMAAEMGISEQDLTIIEASRNDVPVFTKASDINLSFIKPVYSKIASSPTKLGEVLAMGIPVIVNSGVGDVADITRKSEAGFVIDSFTDEELKAAVDAIPSLIQTNPATTRKNIEDVYSLEKGVQLYYGAYKKLLEK
jgi:glycosyltransferase involved in cell wall biosynthesis